MKEFYPDNNFSIIQDSAPSHRAKIIQNFLREELKSRFVANTEWSPSGKEGEKLLLLERSKRKGVQWSR